MRMIDALRNARMLPALLSACALIAASSEAVAIPYFNAPYGFDNTTLALPADYVIPLDAQFPYIASNDTSLDLILLSDDVINDTPNQIDRLITWTMINTTPDAIGSFLVFLTAVVPGPDDYSGANIDVDIVGYDPMVIATYGPYTFAGYYMTPEDFTLVNGELTAVRQFRYTVDIGQLPGGPPDLGIAYVTSATPVPEPGTGLLLASAVGLAVAATRRLTPCA